MKKGTTMRDAAVLYTAFGDRSPGCAIFDRDPGLWNSTPSGYRTKTSVIYPQGVTLHSPGSHAQRPHPGSVLRLALIAVAFFGMLAEATAQPAAKDTRAAEFTRDRFLKVKMTVEFKNTPLREALKVFAAEIQMDKEFDKPVMWTYADSALGDKPVTFSCTDKPLDAALEAICTKLKLGYFVISEADHPRDGWIRITAGTERGIGSLTDKPAPKTEDEDEAKATTRLAVAKEQIEKSRIATAKAVLNGIVEKFPKTKAAVEAKALLEKLDK